MSAGAFENGFYAADNGDIFSCKTQPETDALSINNVVNAQAAGPRTVAQRARLSGSRRKLGCRARSVRIRFSDAVPEGYKPDSIIELPVYQKSIYDGYAALGEGATGVYLTLPIELVGWTPESRK